MHLRPALPADAAALAACGHDSFVHAFAHLYAKADLDQFLADCKTQDKYARMIADPGYRVCLADDGSEGGGAIAGFCILAIPSDFADHSDAANPVALSQLYCAPGRSGQGIGAALMDWALAEAAALGADAIQLSVWSGNHGAQKFYARHGFGKIADFYFMVGSQRDDEFLLEKRLP